MENYVANNKQISLIKVSLVLKGCIEQFEVSYKCSLIPKGNQNFPCFAPKTFRLTIGNWKELHTYLQHFRNSNVVTINTHTTAKLEKKEKKEKKKFSIMPNEVKTFPPD